MPAGFDFPPVLQCYFLEFPSCEASSRVLSLLTANSLLPLADSPEDQDFCFPSQEHTRSPINVEEMPEYAGWIRVVLSPDSLHTLPYFVPHCYSNAAGHRIATQPLDEPSFLPS